MLLTCPHCKFSKQLDPTRIPAKVSTVNCPSCKQSFPLPQPDEALPTITEPEKTVLSPQGSRLSQVEVDALPKAGFWSRLVATLIDGTLVFILQLGLGLLLSLAGFATGDSENAVALILLVQLFTIVTSFAYYVSFIGYCGQTPGKMAVRVKVIQRNGEQISYLRAAFREIPCKFVSAIILGIGFLMVAFDDQKQGLHDRMADTYVIKL